MVTENSPNQWQLWRHKKRGTIYKIIGTGRLQLTGPHDESEVVMYQSNELGDAQIWVRLKSEFLDGRFERYIP